MINIRSAKFDERETIADFQLKMAKETENLDLDLNTVKAGITSVFEDPAKGQYFVAEESGKLLASLMITYEWSDWRNAAVWWIQSVYVLPNFRKRGIFGMMYRFISQLTESDPNVAGIRLYVDLSNKTARSVYTKLGMNGEHYQLFEDMKNL